MNFAYSTLGSKEGHHYSETSKLRLLLKKVKGEFLGSTKASIEVQMAEIPQSITYN